LEDGVCLFASAAQSLEVCLLLLGESLVVTSLLTLLVTLGVFSVDRGME
jgi:hypothetical protein